MSSLLVIAILLPALVRSESYYGTGIDLTILHTNEVNGLVDEAYKSGSACYPWQAAKNECLGGAARM